MRASFIEVDGITTRYLHASSGRDGRPLVLLHGFNSSGDSWYPNIDALSASRPVVALDLLGHGFTDPGELSDQPPHRATLEHVLSWIDRLGLDAMDVGGNSFGALMAGLVWFERPEAVRRLVLVGSGAVFEPESELQERLADVEQVVAEFVEAPLSRLRELLAASMGTVAAEALAIAFQTIHARPGIADYAQVAARAMGDVAGWHPHRIFERLEQVAAPTLVVWGSDDGAPWQHGAAGVERMPDAEFSLFEGCGHHPHLQQPERFNALVDDFLGA